MQMRRLWHRRGFQWRRTRKEMEEIADRRRCGRVPPHLHTRSNFKSVYANVPVRYLRFVFDPISAGHSIEWRWVPPASPFPAASAAYRPPRQLRPGWAPSGPNGGRVPFFHTLWFQLKCSSVSGGRSINQHLVSDGLLTSFIWVNGRRKGGKGALAVGGDPRRR